MQQPSAEVELNKLADLCASLRLHDDGAAVAGNLLDPIASVLGAESAAYRHLDLQNARPLIKNLASIGVADSVSDDYLTHFHRFDPFLKCLADQHSASNATFALTGKHFQRYYHKFLKPNGLVHHAGFMLRDLSGQQAWIFNFHRRESSAEFIPLELARARLIEACLQCQLSNAGSAKASPEAKTPPAPPLRSLTAREQEVARAVAQGWANKKIADRLGISPSTVENHLRKIYEKLQINTRTQLISRLFRTD